VIEGENQTMSEPRHNKIELETGRIRLSPHGFRQWAKEFYQSRKALQPNGFSPVPYFLLCRAIELWFKAVHLEANETLRPDDFKRQGNMKIGHVYAAEQ
jgi:hypothetical protein